METVVQIGAGAVGRGFLAQLWCDAGYETVFVDADETLVARLGAARSYRVRLVGHDGSETRTISPVRAIRASDTEAVADALASCAFAATAVGARNIQAVAQTLIAPALPRRTSPLNVFLCENGASIQQDFLAGLGNAAGSVGTAECVVGRGVPEPQTNTLDLMAEAFAELPFNTGDWRGAVPGVAGLLPVPAEAFSAYELRKRFLHNGGHAVLAYHGARRGHETVAQCAEDAAIVAELRGFWREVCAAFVHSKHNTVPIFAPEVLRIYTEDLLWRFRVAELGDTVVRVGRDPRRKLAASDRLTGAALFCLAQGVEPVYAVRAIVAALHSDSELPLFAEVAGLVYGHPLVARVQIQMQDFAP